MKKPLVVAVLVSTVSQFAIADSVFSSNEDSVEYRQAAFTLIRHNMVDISDMLKGDVTYDAARVTKRANALATLTTLPWDAFTVPGAELGGGNAKAEIWQNLNDFTSRAQKLATDALALQVAAQSGVDADIKKAFGTFARNCKACHEQYKK